MSTGQQRPVTVILTATVTPQVSVSLSATHERLAQYRSALESWCELPATLIRRIALVENSGCEPGLLAKGLRPSARSRLTTIAAPPPAEDVIRRGKGFAESEMIRFALSELDLPDEEVVTKATGRLVSRNYVRCVARLPDYPFLRARFTLDLCQMDTRLFLANAGVLRDVFVPGWLDINEPAGRWIEHSSASAALRSIASGGLVLSRFPATPALFGVSGTTGSAHSGMAWLARQLGEDVLRRLTRRPMFWL